MSEDIELLLFSTHAPTVEKADRAGIDGFIVDWEDRNRFQRKHNAADQRSADTEVDLARISGTTGRPVWCRINQPGDWTPHEVEQAIENGADLILLPMVKSPEEVEHFLSLVGQRARKGILVETVEACECAEELATLPLDRVYVGLFDLSMSRGSEHLFNPLMDGTVETLRDVFRQKRFGVGGLTTVDGGKPVPCLELMAELSRLECDFTFLRNSFMRDVAGKQMSREVAEVRKAWKQISARDATDVDAQHRVFCERYYR